MGHHKTNHNDAIARRNDAITRALFKAAKCGERGKPIYKDLGTITIDSGTLLLADPLFAEDADAEDKAQWEKVKDNKAALKRKFGTVARQAGHGVVVYTGMGDGFYRVLGRVDPASGWPLDIFISFIDADEGRQDSYLPTKRHGAYLRGVDRRAAKRSE